jgi:putative endonuclease
VNNLFKKEEGELGERLAVEYLKKQGFKIIDRNFRIRGGEIDIIAIDPSASSGQDGDTLVFIEVKTRRSNEFGTPFEAITPWKMRALIKSAEFYKIKHPRLPDSMRIDAVGIVLTSNNEIASIELVKNIS